MKNLMTMALPVMAFLFATNAAAANLDSSRPLICAAVDAVDCSAFDQCQRVTPQMVNLPRFIRIDLQNKELSGDGRKTPIEHVTHVEHQVIMQGVRGGRAWSMSLSTQTGDLTGTVTDDGFGFVVFGVCTSLESVGS